MEWLQQLINGLVPTEPIKTEVGLIVDDALIAKLLFAIVTLIAAFFIIRKLLN